MYKVPKKVLRYFPIKKTLQRLFLSCKIARITRWHDEDRKKDGLLRHPADSPLWQDFDERHPEFSADTLLFYTLDLQQEERRARTQVGNLVQI